MKAIYFDMDGTIADLYGYQNWESKLRQEDVTPYRECQPLVDMNILNQVLTSLTKFGIIIGIISWSAKGGSKNYNKQVRRAKKEWCNKYLPCITEFHVVKYGTPKHYVRKERDSILIDDNAEVRQAWKGETIDASQPHTILKQLFSLLENLQKEVVYC